MTFKRIANKLLFITLIILSIGLNAQINPDLANKLQKALEEEVSQFGNNGVSAYLQLPSSLYWSGTAGIGKGGTPITDSTVFHGASTTKLNVAVLMLLLAEDELIDLDASWNSYLSLEVDFDKNITVRQLLNHTSGISDYLETSSAELDITSDYERVFDPKEILETKVNPNPLFLPGQGFQYSNSNYVLAALIAEEVTGMPVHHGLRQRIWEPLGMEHTYFGGYESYTEPQAGVWWNFGSGYSNYSDKSVNSMLSYAFGAGNIVTCPRDLALFMDELFNGQLLKEESKKELLEIVSSSKGSWTNGYGLGIHHAPDHIDDNLVGHDGYYTNLTSMFYHSTYQYTLVTMTNTQSEWFKIFHTLNNILDEHLIINTTNTSLNENVILYPNPNSSLSFRILSDFIFSHVEIRDLMGNLVFNGEVRSNEVSCDNYQNGVYFVTLKSDLGSKAMKMIVKY